MPELAYETKCRICGKWYRAQTDASAICHPCAEARVAELEACLAKMHDQFGLTSENPGDDEANAEAKRLLKR